MQLFAGELTNQNREYYEVNDNGNYFNHKKVETLKCMGLGGSIICNLILMLYGNSTIIYV